MSKRLALLIIAILAVPSLIMVESAFAQSAPKPSVPEFTLKFVDNSYDVPPTTTTTTDPYTGNKIVTTHAGYHVENKTIDITIKNQPFVSAIKETTYQLYYNVRHKGSFEDTWTERSWAYDNPGSLVPQSNSQYTVISYSAQSYPINASLDFQVEAIIGSSYERRVFSDDWLAQHPLAEVMQPGLEDIYEREFHLERSSGWSNTQTLIIPASTPSTPSPTTTPSPTNYTGVHLTEQEIIAGAAITAAVIIAFLGLLIYLIKRR